LNGGPRVVAVVPTRDRRRTLGATLAALGAQLRAGDALVVVDDASSDGSAAEAAAAAPGATVLRREARGGFAGAAQDGIEEALRRGARFVLLWNDDALPAPGAVGALVAHLEAHPAAGAAQALLLDAADPGRIDSAGIEASPGVGFRDALRGEDAARAPAAPGRILGACAAAALYRAAALREAGGFDRAFFLLLEDADLALRLREAGWEAWLVPAARALHARGVSGSAGTAAASAEAALCLRRNAVALELRWAPAGRLARGAPRLLSAAARALLSPAASPGGSCARLWLRALAARRGESPVRGEPVVAPPAPPRAIR
jgi:GT2 family glycosyltransferase